MCNGRISYDGKLRGKLVEMLLENPFINVMILINFQIYYNEQTSAIALLNIVTFVGSVPLPS